jgi:hypothetical protein
MRLMIALACVALIGACQPTAKPAPPVPPAPASAPVAAPAPPSELAAGTHAGVLTLIEDAGYPMFWLTLTPEGGAPQRTLVNNEKAAIEGGLETLKGRHISVTVAAKDKVAIYELAGPGGASLVFEGMQKPQAPAAVETVTGVLSGAGRAANPGDPPAPLKITPRAGKAVAFEWFVTPKLQAQNGKTVTLTYAIERELEAVAVKPAPK